MADRRHAAQMAATAPTAGDRWNCNSQSDRLQPRPLAGTDPLPRPRRSAERQQLDRESDPSNRAGALELAICWIAARGQACRGDHELDSIGSAQRSRSVSIPQRRARSIADATRAPHQQIAATQLDGSGGDELIPRVRARCVARTVTGKLVPVTVK